MPSAKSNHAHAARQVAKRLILPASAHAEFRAGRLKEWRVPMKEQPPEGVESMDLIVYSSDESREGKWLGQPGGWLIECPHKPGDSLWLPETWALAYLTGATYCTPDGLECDSWTEIWTGKTADKPKGAGVVFRSDNDQEFQDEMQWRPSTSMPQWACRTFARIVSIRVERRDVWEWVLGLELESKG